ncbi:MAG: hypothetical protein ACE5MG_12600 [Candidatus Methylomirabilales bacterium]
MGREGRHGPGQRPGIRLSLGGMVTFIVPRGLQSTATIPNAIAADGIGVYWTEVRGGTIKRGVPPGTLVLSLAATGATFTPGDSMTISVGVDNPGIASTVDFLFGALLPDGDTVVFFTDLAFNTGVGSLSAPSTLQPIVAGVDLAAPFTFNQPAFFTFTWAGPESAGSYILFLAAVVSGALADNSIDAGDIVAVSTAEVVFTP